jgi:hypothetical protein
VPAQPIVNVFIHGNPRPEGAGLLSEPRDNIPDRRHFDDLVGEPSAGEIEREDPEQQDRHGFTLLVPASPCGQKRTERPRSRCSLEGAMRSLQRSAVG